MSPFNTGGYDAAQARPEEDDLDRWRFAAEIVEVVLGTPSDWSARIGIFGKWGQGKTTVLRFAEQMLKEKQNVVFWFSPWATQSWNDLWEEFGSCLMEALESAKIPFEGGWKKATKALGRELESTGVAPILQTAATLFGREKVYEAAFGALNRWLKYDGEQIRAIREKLGDRRIVVLIDDLDRCDPKLIPQLLLSLRELLDLPAFTFLLAFDDEIVGRALTDENPAWVVGADFLEKILDFRFHLPPVTSAQKERLIYRAIAKYCPFVPKESAQQIQDLLPVNPRKLKALIRSLAALKPQISRHDSDELNWVDMWLAQMIRLESHSFLEHLIVGDTMDKEIGALYRVMLSHKKNPEDKNQRLKSLIEQSGVKDSATTQRLVQLIEAVRSRSSFHFRYVCELAVRPPAVTWKEFRSLYSNWVAHREASTLSSWIQQHSKERGVGINDVENELFEAVMGRRNQCLSMAAESASMGEHDSFVREADALLDLIQQALIGLGKVTAPRFKNLYGQAFYWIGFRKNQTDKSLRKREEALLLELLHSASNALSSELFEVVVPERWSPDIAEVAEEKRALRSKCLAIVAPKAAKEAVTFMERDGGIKSLSERERFPAAKYCLFNPESPIWKTGLQDDLNDVIRRGRDSLVIYGNVRDLFALLVEGLERGIDLVGKQEIKALLSNEAFVRNLWESVTSRGIQYRMQMSFVQGRQTLIHNGIPETLLPLTSELQVRLKEEELGAANPEAGASTGQSTPDS